MHQSKTPTQNLTQILTIGVIEIDKIYLPKDEELTTDVIGKIIRYFELHHLPLLRKYEQYYSGNHDIMRREVGDDSRPNNRIVKNYCASIVDNFQGYITGVPVTYTAKDDTDISELMQIFAANDVVNTDSNFLLDALKYGVSYELCYINESQEKKFKNLDAKNVIPIYANDLDEELLYVIYYYPIVSWEDPVATKYKVNVYSRSDVFSYVSGGNFSFFGVAEEPKPHYFQQVPFVIFDLNRDNRPVFDRVITLNDAYNTLLSDEVNDFESFVDAYMVLKNLDATAEELAAMKQSRTILIDGESDVDYLTKNISDTQIQNLLDNIQQSIHTISNSPDFSSEEFNSGVSSGVALQYKLVGFNNVASSIEAQFRKALQKRIELLNSILSLVDSAECKVNISFTHNLPANLTDIVNNVNALRGLVSDETLLAQIPFIEDTQKEIEKVKEQNADKQQYYFNNFDSLGTEDPEEE